jgi:hypothetical protein
MEQVLFVLPARKISMRRFKRSYCAKNIKAPVQEYALLGSTEYALSIWELGGIL